MHKLRKEKLRHLWSRLIEDAEKGESSALGLERVGMV